MKIITVASLKGGVGKTTVALFLAQALAEYGKTLIIDLDPNNNATDYQLPDTSLEALESDNVFHALTKRKPLTACIHGGLFLDIAPATLNLLTASHESTQNPGLMLRFRKEIEKTSYSYVVIDTPPSIDPLFRTGLYSADVVLTPIAPTRWVRQAVSFLLKELDTVRENTDRQPQLLALASLVTPKEAEFLAEKLQDIPLAKVAILRQASLKNAIETQRAIKTESKAGQQFAQLAKEVA